MQPNNIILPKFTKHTTTMNTYTLIKTADNHYILTSDEDINESIDSIWYGAGKDNSVIRRKAYTNITFTDEVAKEIGYVDIEKLADASSEKHEGSYYHYQGYLLGFKDGYLQAIDDNKDKVYSLEDMRKCFEEARERVHHPDWDFIYDKFEDYINSITPAQWQVEIEMENYSKPEDGHSAVHKEIRPKITNNSINVIAIK